MKLSHVIKKNKLIIILLLLILNIKNVNAASIALKGGLEFNGRKSNSRQVYILDNVYKSAYEKIFGMGGNNYGYMRYDNNKTIDRHNYNQLVVDCYPEATESYFTWRTTWDQFGWFLNDEKLKFVLEGGSPNTECLIYPPGTVIKKHTLSVGVLDHDTSTFEEFKTKVSNGRKASVIIDHTYKDKSGNLIKINKDDISCNGIQGRSVSFNYSESTKELSVNRMTEDVNCTIGLRTLGEEESEVAVLNFLISNYSLSDIQADNTTFSETVKKGETASINVTGTYNNKAGEIIKIEKRYIDCRNSRGKVKAFNYNEDTRVLTVTNMEENIFCGIALGNNSATYPVDSYTVKLNIKTIDEKINTKTAVVKKYEDITFSIDSTEISDKYTLKCDVDGYAEYNHDTKKVKVSKVDKDISCDLTYEKGDGSDGSSGPGDSENSEEETESLKITLIPKNGSFPIGYGSSRKIVYEDVKKGEVNKYPLVIIPKPDSNLRADKGVVTCKNGTNSTFEDNFITFDKPESDDTCYLELDKSDDLSVSLIVDMKSVNITDEEANKYKEGKTVPSGQTVTFNKIIPRDDYDKNKAVFSCNITENKKPVDGTNAPGYESQTGTFLVANVVTNLQCNIKFEKLEEDPEDEKIIHFEFKNSTSEGKSKFTKTFTEDFIQVFKANNGYTVVNPTLTCAAGINADNEGNIYIYADLVEKKESDCLVEAAVDIGEDPSIGDYNVEVQYIDGTDSLGNTYDSVSVNDGETANIIIKGGYLIDSNGEKHVSGLEGKKITCSGDYKSAQIVNEDSNYIVRVEEVKSHILCTLDVVKDAESEYDFTFNIKNGSFINDYEYKFSSTKMHIYTLTVDIGTEVYNKQKEEYTYIKDDIVCSIKKEDESKKVDFSLNSGVLIIENVDGDVNCLLTVPDSDDEDAYIGLNEKCFEDDYPLKDKYIDDPFTYKNQYTRCCEVPDAKEKMGTIVYDRLCSKKVCESSVSPNICQAESTKGYIYEAGNENNEGVKGITKENIECVINGKRSEDGEKFELDKNECPACGNYCTIYCKEDLETFFPGVGYNPKSETSIDAGKYFTFKPYTDNEKTYDPLPYIQQQRTCVYITDLKAFAKDMYGLENLKTIKNIKGGYYKEANEILEEYFKTEKTKKESEIKLNELNSRSCIVAKTNEEPTIRTVSLEYPKKDYLNIVQLANNKDDRCTTDKIGCRCCDKYEWIGNERKCVKAGKYSTWESDDPEVHMWLTKSSCKDLEYTTEFIKVETQYIERDSICNEIKYTRKCNSRLETDEDQRRVKEQCEQDIENQRNDAKKTIVEKDKKLIDLREKYERITTRIQLAIKEFNKCTDYNNVYQEIDIPKISDFRYDEMDLYSDDETIPNIGLEVKEEGSVITEGTELEYCDENFVCGSVNWNEINLPTLKTEISSISSDLNNFIEKHKCEDITVKTFNAAISTATMSQQYGLNTELFAVKPTGKVVTRKDIENTDIEKYNSYNALGYGLPVNLRTRANNYNYSFKVSNLGRNNMLFKQFAEYNEEGIYRCSYFVRNQIVCPKKGCPYNEGEDGGIMNDYELIPFIRKVNLDDSVGLTNEEYETNWTDEIGQEANARMNERGQDIYLDLPMYEYIVGPEELRSIKEYNKENPYSDFKLRCNEEGNYCESEFVTQYADQEITRQGRENWIEFNKKEIE